MEFHINLFMMLIFNKSKATVMINSMFSAYWIYEHYEN